MPCCENKIDVLLQSRNILILRIFCLAQALRFPRKLFQSPFGFIRITPVSILPVTHHFIHAPYVSNPKSNLAVSIKISNLKKSLHHIQTPLILVLEMESYQGDSNAKIYFKIQTKSLQESKKLIVE